MVAVVVLPSPSTLSCQFSLWLLSPFSAHLSPSPLLPSLFPWSFKMFQQKMILPLVLWRQAMDGSVRTALCASPGGTGPSMASPTSTILPSPCWRCSSASPWRAGQMCCTGYVTWDGQRQGVQKAVSLSSTSPFSSTLPMTLWSHTHLDGIVDECLWFLPGLSWETKHEICTLMSLFVRPSA